MSTHIPYPSSKPLAPDELIRQCTDFRAFLEKRRSLRFFSDHPVPREAVEQLIMAASSAPSGANKQPWTFCAVSSPELKKQIREAAEEEEYRSYHGRMSEEWLRDLAPFGTDWQKPFLETAPWLIIVFRRIYEFGEEGKKENNYYVSE
jgi:iodotyrosine deiodinase